MKTYRALLLTSLFLLIKWAPAIALVSIKRDQYSDVGVQLVSLTAYKPLRVGIPGRREGAGTR